MLYFSPQRWDMHIQWRQIISFPFFSLLINTTKAISNIIYSSFYSECCFLYCVWLANVTPLVFLPLKGLLAGLAKYRYRSERSHWAEREQATRSCAWIILPILPRPSGSLQVATILQNRVKMNFTNNMQLKFYPHPNRQSGVGDEDGTPFSAPAATISPTHLLVKWRVYMTDFPSPGLRLYCFVCRGISQSPFLSFPLWPFNKNKT